MVDTGGVKAMSDEQLEVIKADMPSGRVPAGRHHDAPQCRLSAEGAVEERALFRLVWPG